MSWLNWVLVAYGVVNVAGGWLGYSRTGSMASIGSGAATFILLLVAVGLSKGNPKLAYGLAGLLTLATLGFFTYRYLSKGTVFPAVPMIVISIAVLACLAVGHFFKARF